MLKSAPADGQACRFCLALAEETAGMQQGTWRHLDTIAHRMGVTLEEASEIAGDCVGRQWVDRVAHSIRLREAGRRVAVGIRKAIISKQQPVEARPSNEKPDSKPNGVEQTTDLEKLQREIYLLGATINSNAAALKSKTMSDEDREALKRQINVRTAHRNLLLQRLDRLLK
jgi:hypothetical protein